MSQSYVIVIMDKKGCWKLMSDWMTLQGRGEIGQSQISLGVIVIY